MRYFLHSSLNLYKCPPVGDAIAWSVCLAVSVSELIKKQPSLLESFREKSVKWADKYVFLVIYIAFPIR